MALAKTESVANKPKRLSHVEARPYQSLSYTFDSLTFDSIIKVAGTRDQKGYLWNGYKGYIGINGGKNGIGIEFGRGPNYQDFTDTKVTTRANLQPGHTYTLRATRENFGNSVRVTIYAQEEGGPE